jgi:cytosine/adenosine deaminase-related metal-dependent hydrolase
VKQLITGGRLLSAGRLDGAPADLLIDGDTIVAVLNPGEPVTEDARRVDASDRLLMPGLINTHTHATVHLGKGLADRWSLELLLDRGWPHDRYEISLGHYRCGRDGAERLHRLLRPDRRNPGAVGRGHRRGRACLQ